MTQAATVTRKRRKINTRKEKPISLRAFGKLVEPPVTYDNMLSLVKDGRESISGKVVTLEKVKMPYGFATTWEAWHRFIDRMNDG